jgi:transforming growth factor-beta-induced protein
MKTLNRRNFLKAALAGALVAGGMGLPTVPTFAQSANIVDTAVAAGSFKTLVAAVQAAGLVETLKGPGPFTVFAPTDDAFAKLPAGTIDNLLKPENKQQLIDILTYHVVAGNVKAADVVKLISAKTVNGADVKITVSGSSVKVNDSNVVQTDIAASNGTIHVIDAVLLPPAAPTPVLPPTGAAAQAAKDIVDTAVGAGSFNTLVAAVQAAGLVETLKGKGPFTVFAPTDDAFAKLPKATLDDLLKPENKATLASILTYHVVPGAVKAADVVKLKSAKTVQGEAISIKVDGSKVMVDDANVTATDVEASNGVIHVIDAVILPPSVAKAMAEPAMAATPKPAAKPVNIVETALAAGNFKTLAAALEAAGLVNTLKGGRWTVFAPTDEAFAKLPAGTVETLLKPENKSQLRDILLYHVARGRLDAAAVTKHSGIAMANGMRTAIKVADGKAMINEATITATDIAATNGIIHVIDTVMLPPGNIAEVADKAGSFTTLLAAVKAAGLEKELTGRGPLTVFAPTDAAFAKLPAGTVEDLLKPENKAKLRGILLYHVARGNIDSATVAKHSNIRTLQGKRIDVKLDGSNVMLNDATVTAVDVLARNGIVHVIDTVLLP